MEDSTKVQGIGIMEIRFVLLRDPVQWVILLALERRRYDASEKKTSIIINEECV